MNRPNCMRLLKKFFVVSFALGAVSYYGLSDRAGGRVRAKVWGGPPLGFTGAPDEGTCVGCHYTFAEPNPPNSGGSVKLTGLPATYTPAQTYTVTVTVSHPTARRWGFETTPIDASGSSLKAGTLTLIDNVRTIKRDAGSRTYISHYAVESQPDSQDGTYPGRVDSCFWSFNWTAPNSSSGDITFYAVGNAANNQVSPEDDYIYATSVIVRAPNSAPVFASLSNRVLGVGDRVSFGVSAVDPEGSAVTFSASALANGTFDPVTRRFTFVPSADQIGMQQVIFTASDGKLETQRSVNLEVAPEDTSDLRGLAKTTGPSNYLDSSQASGINLTAEGEFGGSAKIVFNGLELASQTALTGEVGLTAQVPADELGSPGAYVVRVRLSNLKLTNARVLALASTINAQQAVTVDAASYNVSVAPGQIAALFGTNLIVGNLPSVAGTVPLPRSLQHASVYINGVQAPLFYAGAGQINLQVPYSTAPGAAQVVILRDDGIASYGLVQVVEIAPAVFTASSTGQGQAAVLNSDFSPNGDPGLNPQLKRTRRDDFIVIFGSGSGKGLVDFNTGQPIVIRDGDAATASPTFATAAAPMVTIGGKEATILFSGLAPGYVGLWQLNVKIPIDAPVGAAVELIVRYGGKNSSRVTIAVE